MEPARRRTAVLFFCAAAGIACSFFMYEQLPLYAIFQQDLNEIAAAASPFVFLSAGILVYLRPRLGYTLGLAAGLMALPWFVQTEFLLNSWVALNYESPFSFPEDERFVAVTKLKIISAALIVITVFCASLRLLPKRWLLRGSPLRQRTWPAFAAGLLALTAWFVPSVTPYRTPGFHGVSPELRILHVRKRGLRFDETMLGQLRDGRTYVSQVRRQLFQYRFERRFATISLPQASPTALSRTRALIGSPELWRLHTPPARLPRSWNAEGWYVLLKDSRLLAFTTEQGTTPPAEITDVFHEIEKLPAERERTFTARDVCLGFCYDPVAALVSSIRR
jgi:hypothetical protein